mmetsp:Transcript_2561/g.8727  ORF Transcript_2561/g.8727 Transcript_2561/m.8727 type:complete len:227 (-) Transcript_2561:366-1046(-)
MPPARRVCGTVISPVLLLFRKKFLTLAKAANWMALPGITLRILGVLPLQNPRTPSFFATSAITPGIVWPPLLAISTTLTRCSGAVRNLDAAPAAPPTKSCFKGSLGFVITLSTLDPIQQYAALDLSCAAGSKEVYFLNSSKVTTPSLFSSSSSTILAPSASEASIPMRLMDSTTSSPVIVPLPSLSRALKTLSISFSLDLTYSTNSALVTVLLLSTSSPPPNKSET